MKKTYKVTANIRFRKRYDYYFISNRGHRGGHGCSLCRETYESVIGKEVKGNVTFVFRKIKGKVLDYTHPFRLRNGNVEIHDGFGRWEYAKSLALLNLAIDGNSLQEWAGNSKLSLSVEY